MFKKLFDWFAEPERSTPPPPKHMVAPAPRSAPIDKSTAGILADARARAGRQKMTVAEMLAAARKNNEEREPEPEEQGPIEDRPPTIEDLRQYKKDRTDELLASIEEMGLFKAVKTIAQTRVRHDFNNAIPLPKSIEKFEFKCEGEHRKEACVVSRPSRIGRQQLYSHTISRTENTFRLGGRGGNEGYQPYSYHHHLATYRFGDWVEDVLKYAEELKVWNQNKREEQEIKSMNSQLDMLEPLDE